MENSRTEQSRTSKFMESVYTFYSFRENNSVKTLFVPSQKASGSEKKLLKEEANYFLKVDPFSKGVWHAGKANR